MNNIILPCDKSETGFTLVELMVSILISAIILAGVVQVVFSTRLSYQSNQEISFIQQNARFVIDLLAKDIRMAGYKGCASSAASEANTISSNLDGFISSIALTGYTGNNHHSLYEADVADDTDSIIVRRGNTDRDYELRRHDSAANVLSLWDPLGIDIEAGLPVLIASQDCTSAALFLANSGGHEISYGGSGNCSSRITGSHSCVVDIADNSVSSQGNTTGINYPVGSRVMEWLTHAYYVGDSSSAPGVPALKRKSTIASGGGLGTRTEELVIGVEDMILRYGFDSDQDGRVDKFVTAADIAFDEDWVNVVSVRADLVFRSEAELNGVDVDTEFQGEAQGDRYMRQLVSTTINLRNYPMEDR